MKNKHNKVWILSIILAVLLVAAAVLMWIFWDDIVVKEPSDAPADPVENSTVGVEIDHKDLYFSGTSPRPTAHTVSFEVVPAQDAGDEISPEEYVAFRTGKATYYPGETVYVEGEILTGTLDKIQYNVSISNAAIIFTSDGTEFRGGFTMPEGDVTIQFIFK